MQQVAGPLLPPFPPGQEKFFSTSSGEKKKNFSSLFRFQPFSPIRFPPGMPFFTRQGRHLFLRLPSAAASHPIHPCSAVVVGREVPAEKEEGKKREDLSSLSYSPFLWLLSKWAFLHRRGQRQGDLPSLPSSDEKDPPSPSPFSLHQFRRENRDLRRKCLTFAFSFLRPLLSSLFGGNGTRKRVMVFSSSSSFLAKGKSTAFSYPHTLTHEEEGKRRDFTDGRGRRRRRRRREGLSAFYDWPVQRRGRVSHFSDFASLLPLSCPAEGGRKGNIAAARPPPPVHFEFTQCPHGNGAASAAPPTLSSFPRTEEGEGRGPFFSSSLSPYVTRVHFPLSPRPRAGFKMGQSSTVERRDDPPLFPPPSLRPQLLKKQDPFFRPGRRRRRTFTRIMTSWGTVLLFLPLSAEWDWCLAGPRSPPLSRVFRLGVILSKPPPPRPSSRVRRPLPGGRHRRRRQRHE